MGITPLDSMGMPVTPGYQLGGMPSYVQSISFAPDIVVIGAWGKHDTEIANSLWMGMLDPVKFKADYERLVTTYLNLPNKPRVIVSTPVPIPKGTPAGPTTMVIWPVVKDTAAKYGLEIVDLYPRFLNHPELYKDDTHVTNQGGLETMADMEYTVIKSKAPPPPPQDGGSVVDAGGNGTGGGGAGGAGSGGATGTAGAAGTAVSGSGGADTTGAGGLSGVGTGPTGAGGASTTTAGEAGTRTSGGASSAEAGCTCRMGGSSADDARSGFSQALFAALAFVLARRRRR
jgi:hypothetical protein